MTKHWQLRVFSLYLTLGIPLAASCAKEANTADDDGSGGPSGGTSISSSGKGSNIAGTLPSSGTTSNPFGGSATAGGKGGSSGATASDGGEAPSVGGSSTGGKGGAGGSATGGSGGSGVPPEVLASASAIVDYKTDHAMASDKTIQMVLNIRNQSNDALPMANVKIRYWFTAEVAPALHQYYTGEDVRPPSAKFVDDGANSHVLLTFGGGMIKKGDILSRSEVQLVIESSTTAFNQADDHSWQPTSTTSTPNGDITLYLDDKLIWGCEPGGACAEAGGDAGGAGGAGGNDAAGGANGNDAAGGAGGALP